MNNNYINQIAAAAQKKFEEAKNLIIQEMQVAMDMADECADECSAAQVVADFINQVFGVDNSDCEPECGMECCGECACDDEEDGIAWINEDEIDFDKDYKEIGILYQKDEDGELKVALEYDADIENDELPALLGKAIVEVICAETELEEVLSKEDVNSVIGECLINAVTKLMLVAINNTISK